MLHCLHLVLASTAPSPRSCTYRPHADSDYASHLPGARSLAFPGAAQRMARAGTSEKEGVEPRQKVDVELKSPRRSGTLHGVVVESLGIAPVKAEEIKAPKHRRKLSFADVWGKETQFPDVPGGRRSSQDRTPTHSRGVSLESLSLPTLPEDRSARDL